MLQICPKLSNQQFEEPPFEEEFLTFLKDLGHKEEIKGMYHKKNVYYAYLLWEDFVYQVENKNVKRSNEMYYPRFTKVIVNFFMTKDSSIPRRNRVNWHFARDDPMFTTIKVVSRHEDTQLYGAILPDELTNEAIKDSESYKEYYAIASGAEPPKTKASVKKKQAGSDKTKTPPTAKGKRLKTSAKVAKPAKQKQPAKTSKAKGLTVLYEVALTEAKQIKLATKRSLIQTHSSHASESGADEGTGGKPGLPNVPTYGSDDEQISWKSSDEENDDEVGMSDDNDDDDDADNQDDDGQDDDGQEYDGQDDEGQNDDNEQTNSDNDGDDFVHPNDEVTQDGNVDGEELNEETDENEEVNELYKDVNVNLEGRDTEMTDAQQTNVQGTHVIEDTHVIMTAVAPEVQQQSSSVSSCFISNMLNPNPDTCIDSILNLNTESTSLVDVPISITIEMPLSFETTIHPPPVTLIQPLVKALEDNFSKFKQTNQFAIVVSLIPDIIDTYLANKMNEVVKTVVQLQSDRLKDEAQAKNADFINKLNDNIKKIIKEQVKAQVKEQVTKILPRIKKTINEQLKVEILTRSSNEAKTSHVIAANLSKLELKKIRIDKMESLLMIHRSDHQKTLYKALVDAYESDKLILDTYGDTVMIKRRRDDQDEDEEPSAGSNRGSKRRRAGKEPESTSAPKEKTSNSSSKSKEGSKSHHTSTGKSAHAEERIQANKDLEEPARQEFDTGFSKDQTVDETTQHHDCNLARKVDTRDSFNELMDTPLDSSAFMMNRLKVDTLTPELLAGPTFELMKGSCKSQQYPHDLRKPLPLILNSQSRSVIPFDHFINNDLAYLRGGTLSQTYATSVTKTKAADYGHVKWIEDLVLNTMWSPVPVIYDKYALWGISHWGRKRQQFYGFSVNRESTRDVYSRHRIIVVTKLQIVEWHNYKHLDWITVRRNDNKLYIFKEGDYKRLHLQDIKDMMLLLVQGKLTNLTIEERLALNVSLRMFTRSIVIQRLVEDLQLAYPNPRGFIYQNKDKKNKLMCVDDGILNDVRTALDDNLKRIGMKYLPQTYWKKVDKDRTEAMIQAIDKQLKNRRIIKNLEKFVGGRPYEGDFQLLQRTI
ncbi:hypothetical protein Tco_1501797 [Tanacetum coccineum]